MFLGQKILGCAAWSVDVELLFGKLRSTDRAPQTISWIAVSFFFVSKISPTGPPGRYQKDVSPTVYVSEFLSLWG